MHLPNFSTKTTSILLGLLLLLFTAVTRFWGLGHLPPGLWFDEAWVSVAAHGSATPAYFAASFGGMHPAIVYLTRAAQQLSANPLIIRYVVASVNTFTVLVAVWAYAAVAGPQQKLNGRAPLPWVGAFILAITYPFFHFGRLGFESSLPAPVALIAFALLGRALRRIPPQRQDMVLLGLVCGLSLYSFDTGRFIPMAVAVAYWWHWAAVAPRRPWRTAVGHFALIVGVATAVAVPILRYFWFNWDQFTARAAITTYNTFGAGADSVPLALGRNLGRTLGGLFIPGWGDVIARHNLPGRPVWDIFLAALCFMGVWALAQRPRSPRTILLVSWAAVGLLPVILTDGAPTYTRIFVALPALAAVAAVGAVWLWGKMAHYGPTVATAVLTIGLLFSTASTLWDYFGRWSAVPQLYDDFQVGVWQAGQMALTKSAAETVLLVPDAIDESNPTLALLLMDSAVRTHPPAPCLYYPAATDQPVTYLINQLADKQMEALLYQVFPQTAATAHIQHQPTGDVIYTALTVPPHQQPHGITLPMEASFAGALQLRGAQITQQPTALTVDLWWLATAVPTADHTLFLHLYPVGAETAVPSAQADVQPCWPTSRWQQGSWVHDVQTIPLPPNLPPGAYTLALGWYTYPTFERLPLTTAAPLPDNRLPLATITISNDQ